MSKILTTFPNMETFEKAMAIIERKNFPHETISPGIAYKKVGVPALIFDSEAKSRLIIENPDFIFSGWVDCLGNITPVPDNTPSEFDNDIFKCCAIVLLAPCVADYRKIRLIVHFDNDVSPALPYLNTEMPQGMYNRETKTFSFMEAYRMIAIHSYRLTIAKANDIVDAWRVIEKVRCLLNDVWSRKDSIQPSYELSQKPPALEIYKRLPGTSCRKCGEKTCMAFALRLWSGETDPQLCRPIFKGDYQHLKDAFLNICSGLGLNTGESS